MEIPLAEFLQKKYADRMNAKNPVNPQIFKFIPFFEEVFEPDLWPVIAKLSGGDGIAHIEQKVLKAGQKVIAKGQFDMMVFWLLKGKVDVVAEINGKPTVVKNYDQIGLCFGELAIIDESERTADVVASTEGATIMEVDWSITDICWELDQKFSKLLLKTINRKLMESYNLTNRAYAALQILRSETREQEREIEELKGRLAETDQDSSVGMDVSDAHAGSNLN